MSSSLVTNEAILRRISERITVSGTWPFLHAGCILLIGEQSANPADSVDQRPFCDTRGCSGWLNAQLELAEISEAKLFWANALHNNGRELDVKNLVDQLLPTLIVALGNVAESLLKKNGLAYVKVPHPQYWKRFRSKETYPLLGILHGCINRATNGEFRGKFISCSKCK